MHREKFFENTCWYSCLTDGTSYDTNTLTISVRPYTEKEPEMLVIGWVEIRLNEKVDINDEDGSCS